MRVVLKWHPRLREADTESMEPFVPTRVIKFSEPDAYAPASEAAASLGPVDAPAAASATPSDGLPVVTATMEISSAPPKEPVIIGKLMIEAAGVTDPGCVRSN